MTKKIIGNKELMPKNNDYLSLRKVMC